MFTSCEAIAGSVGHVVFGFVRDYEKSYECDLYLLIGLSLAIAPLCLCLPLVVPNLDGGAGHNFPALLTSRVGP